METDDSSSRSQKPSRYLSMSCTRSTQSTPPTYFLKIRFNSTLPSRSTLSKWSFSFRFPTKIPQAPIFPHTYYMLAHLILLCLITRTVCGEKFCIMKLLIMLSLPFPCYLVPKDSEINNIN